MILASAGAGKSRYIAEQALKKAAGNQTILILTYTVSNQEELLEQICRINRVKPRNVVIKGWFTFLLEDMIRPYQRCMFPARIVGIDFNATDPHVRGHFTIKGRGEKIGDSYNPRHFLTSDHQKAHTTYLSKLAARINEEAEGKPVQRLAEIYDAVYIDEVQDLGSWDFDVLKAVAGSGVGTFECVGDFRQTIYRTSPAKRKKPVSDDHKLAAFQAMGFVPEHMSISWRCIQVICKFADLLHASEGRYPPTESMLTEVPAEFHAHHGIFVVPPSHVAAYMDCYNPVILRWSVATAAELCTGRNAYNFGEAKGLGFDRVLIVPTKSYTEFIGGKHKVFQDAKTAEAKNKLYVAITRARYSVAFIYDCAQAPAGLHLWSPQSPQHCAEAVHFDGVVDG